VGTHCPLIGGLVKRIQANGRVLPGDVFRDFVESIMDPPHEGHVPDCKSP
jgi:hypothetical protein